MRGVITMHLWSLHLIVDAFVGLMLKPLIVSVNGDFPSGVDDCVSKKFEKYEMSLQIVT